MSEMALTADRLIIIGRGRLIADTTIEAFLGDGVGSFVRVRSPQADLLATALRARGVTVVAQTDGTLRITGANGDTVGQVARENSVTLQELSTQQATLEQRYLELTSDTVDYRATDGALADAHHAN
jgi:ABC-2 type transport system ATP-binding protein